MQGGRQQTLNDLVVSWRWTARTANVANLRATDNLNWRNFALGGASATLGAIVALGIFATLQEGTKHLWVRLAAGAVAFLAAGLAGLWKYLDYGTRARRHESTSRAYGNLVRRIDLELECTNPMTCEVAQTLRAEMDAIDNDAPNVSPLVWHWAVDSVCQERATRGHNRELIDASTINRGAVSRMQRLWTRLFK
jgi:hypothetical protein